jgi:pimeloyl-ACP methyl ester carboxylesterase
MRKSTKALLALGAAIATPVIINHVIAKKAQERVKPRFNESLYNWEYGDIRYLVLGDGEPLLLVHGIYPGAGALEFKEVINELAQEYKVYAIDLLGFGYSDKPDISYCNYLYVRLIKNFIEDIIGKPVIAAASLHSAAALANCAKLNPDLFSKLILISPTGTTKDPDPSDDNAAAAKMALESPILGTSIYHILTSKKALPDFFESGGLASKPNEEFLEELYLAAHAGGTGGKFPISALVAKFFNTDIRQTLAVLEMPYHIIAGGIPPNSKTFALWQEVGEGFDARIIENARLLPHLDNPEAFKATLKELL